MNSRREFLVSTTQALAGATAVLAISPARLRAVQNASQAIAGAAPPAVARDEVFWTTVAQAFHVDGRYVILNGGGQNPPTTAVVNALVRYEQYASAQQRPNNLELLAQADGHRRRLAHHLGCAAEEVAITRNTTEGLNIIAHGLELQRGDEVLISAFDTEYAGKAFMNRVMRDGISLRQVPLPVPPTDDDVVTRFRAAITPRTRLLVASHVADGFGFVLPIRRLSDLAHESGIPLLADGALSFAHLQVDVTVLGCDFYASSLHKWLGAPLGTGVLYVARQRLPRLWPLYGVTNPTAADARKFEEIGTRSGPTLAAIGQALDFHDAVGAARKEARLRYLLQYVIDGLASEPRVRVITDLDPQRRSSLARVTIQGWHGRALEDTLRDRFGIWVYGRFDDEWGGIYVSPNLFNLPPQLDRFVGAIKTLAAEAPRQRVPQ